MITYHEIPQINQRSVFEFKETSLTRLDSFIVQMSSLVNKAEKFYVKQESKTLTRTYGDRDRLNLQWTVSNDSTEFTRSNNLTVLSLICDLGGFAVVLFAIGSYFVDVFNF